MVKRIGRFEGSVSWSKLDMAETCLARFFWTHVSPPPGFVFVQSPALAKGSRVHDNLDKWLNGQHPGLCLEALPMRADLAVLKKFKPRTEEEWAFDENFEPRPLGFRKGDYLRGKIDALKIAHAKSATVIDFKTGKNRGGKGEQPRFYGMLVLIREPRVTTVQPEFWYVEHGAIEPGEIVHRKELPALRRDYARRFIKIYAEKAWPAKKNQYCNWCDFSKTKGGPCEAA